MRSENFPNPRGFLSGVSLAILSLLLLLDPHKTRVANGGELPISESLAHNSTEEQQEPSCVVKLPTVKPEALLFAVAEEVPRSDGNVSSLDRPFEQGEEILGGVGMCRLANKFASRVIDDGVLINGLQASVGGRFVGIERSSPLHVAEDIPTQGFGVGLPDNECTGLPLPLNDQLDRSFIDRSPPQNRRLPLPFVHVLGFAADVRFVGLDLAVEFLEGVGLHRLSDAVEHEPRGSLGDSDCPAEFVAADSILAVGNRPDCNEPFVQTKRRILEDRANLEAELLLATGSVAFDRAGSGRQFLAGIVAALWAGDLSARPFDRTHEIVAVRGLRKVANGFEEGLGDCVHLCSSNCPPPHHLSVAGDKAARERAGVSKKGTGSPVVQPPAATVIRGAEPRVPVRLTATNENLIVAAAIRDDYISGLDRSVFRIDGSYHTRERLVVIGDFEIFAGEGEGVLIERISVDFKIVLPSLPPRIVGGENDFKFCVGDLFHFYFSSPESPGFDFRGVSFAPHTSNYNDRQ